MDTPMTHPKETALPLGSQRHLFDVPRHVAYFNCASSTPQLRAASERLAAAAQAKAHPWTRTPDDYLGNAETIRQLCAGLIGGESDGYAVVPSASYAIATATRALEPSVGSGDHVVMMAEEFPSMVLALRRLAAERGAHVAIVPTPADGDWSGALVTRIAEGARVVGVSSCHWTNGARVDLVAVAHACRSAGAFLVVDGTQTVGAMPFDMEAIAPDVLASSGYKWMMAPDGVSLLDVAPQWRDARPLEEAGLARHGAEDFAGLVSPSDRYQPGARRFDMGEKGHALLPGAIAGLEQLRAWGVPAIAASLAQVNERVTRRLGELGFTLPPEELRCPHMFGAEPPSGFPADIAARLRAQDIHISRRGRSLRFAPHLHVDEADIERLLGALESIAAKARA
ncbi:MAG TPA: aminotransferase class V-fold PLP-dependent enzyme [Casimicrobiaceae bacterium]|nr:aminotransferase class V-fold PLP-dependent enzyme [Casimicrobiaceae bacterium]